MHCIDYIFLPPSCGKSLHVCRFASVSLTLTNFVPLGGKQFFFSWEEGPKKYTWAQADERCRYLGMNLVSLDNAEKNYYISSEIEKYSKYDTSMCQER